MDQNVISVIIPIFNCGQYLEKSVPALLNQTWDKLELILVDDGSTDNSLAICRKFERQDARVKVLHKEKSGGAGPARNDGMHAANGEFLMFIDADDWIEPNMLEKLHTALTESGCDIAICGYESFVEGAPNNKAVISFEKKIYNTPEKTRALSHRFSRRASSGIFGTNCTARRSFAKTEWIFRRCAVCRTACSMSARSAVRSLAA